MPRKGPPRAVNVHQAKTHLSRLLNRVERGEEIIIAKNGVPLARLVPMETGPIRRTPGGWEGTVTIADDFDDPIPPELLAAFGG